MLRVISDGIWTEIKKLSRRGQAKYAAIAYVTSDVHLRFGKGDILVCDASDTAIGSGQTAVEILRKARGRGATIYSSPGLHAKALVLGRVAVVGSANMSASSASTLNEAALVTDDARAVAGVRLLVRQLAEGSHLVDEKFLARIGKLKVRAARRGSERRRGVTVGEPRAWLISVVPLDEKRHRSEDQVVEAARKRAAKQTEFADSDPGYLRWTGNSAFRKYAKAGDIVITIWRPHSKSKRGIVYAPEPLLHRKDQGTVTHVFVEDYADREDTATSFTDFVTLWRRAGERQTPSVKSTREVSPELVERLRRMMQR